MYLYADWKREGIRDLQEEINRMFEEASGRMTRCFLGDCGWSPLVDIYEKEDEIVVVAELPGLSRECISIDVSDSVLTISGNRSDGSLTDEVHSRMERNQGKFERTFSLPGVIDGAKATAVFRDGLLRIALPRIPVEKPLRIDISGEES